MRYVSNKYAREYAYRCICTIYIYIHTLYAIYTHIWIATKITCSFPCHAQIGVVPYWGFLRSHTSQTLRRLMLINITIILVVTHMITYAAAVQNKYQNTQCVIFRAHARWCKFESSNFSSLSIVSPYTAVRSSGFFEGLQVDSSKKIRWAPRT